MLIKSNGDNGNGFRVNNGNDKSLYNQSSSTTTIRAIDCWLKEDDYNKEKGKIIIRMII